MTLDTVSDAQLSSVEENTLEALKMAEEMLRNIDKQISYDSGDFWRRVCAIQYNLRSNKALTVD